MARLSPDQQPLYDALIDGLSKLVTGRSTGSGSRNSDESQIRKQRANFIKGLDKNIQTTDNINDALAEMLVTVADSKDSTKTYNSAVNKAASALINSSKTLNQFQNEIDVLAHKTIPEQRRYLETQSKITKGLTTELGKTIRNQSLFSASLLEGHSEIKLGTAKYTDMIHNMYESSKGLSPAMLKAAGVLDEKTGEIKDGLKPADFAKLRLSLGVAETAIAESFGQFNKLGFGDMQKIIAEGGEKLSQTMFTDNEAGKQFKAALLSATLQLQTQGIAIGPNLRTSTGGVNAKAVESLQTDPQAMKDLAASIKKLQEGNNTGTSGLNAIAKESNSVTSSLTQKFKALGSPLQLVKDRLLGLANAASIAANFEKFKAGVKQVYQQMQSFNIANVPATFANVQLASVKMGMSFDDTVKFMQENKNTMAIYGASFGGLLDSFKGTFARFGYTMAQGAPLVAASIDEAIASGVNIRNGDGLNKFINQTMLSFDKLGGMIDVTREQYIKQTAQMLSSSDVQSTLLGLDSASAQVKAQDLIKSRDLLVTQGLSLEMADAEIRRQQASNNAPVRDRMLNAAHLMQQAQVAGMSAQEGSRLQYLSLRGKYMTVDEKAEYTALNNKRYQGIAQYQQRAASQGINTQLSSENLMQNLAVSDQGDIDKTAEVELGRQRSQSIQTPAERAASAAAAKGSQSVATLGNAVNMIDSAKNNAFVNAALGATGALAGLMLQATLTGRALGGLGGGGIVGNVLSKGAGLVGGALSGTAGVLEGGLAAGGGAAVAAGAGLAAIGTTAVAGVTSAIYSAIQLARGKDASSYLSDALGVGAGGKMDKVTDTIFGGISSLATGVMSIKDSIFGKDAPGPNAPSPTYPGSDASTSTVNNNNASTSTAPTAPDGQKIADTQDLTAHAHLENIADSTQKLVDIMTSMQDDNNTPTLLTRNRKVPSAYSFTSGNNPR